MEVAIMIEGQNGLNWGRWQRMARAVEDLGFVGLFRSDHYTNSNPPDRDSLELWTSLTWLADNTSRIEFGPLVSPVSFRQPTMTARMATAVDELSDGRLRLGLGAGWQEREHHNYGWDLLSVQGRMDRLAEGLAIITHLFNSEEPLTFEGEYYQLHDAVLLPRPHRPGGPPIVIGGNGPRRTLPLAAEYADEWNGIMAPVQRLAELNSRLDELAVAAGRKPEAIRRSLMTGTVFGRDDGEVAEKMERYNRSADELRERGLVVGTANEFVEQIGRFGEAGVQRIMLQWLELDDLDRLEAMAKGILPQLH